MAASNFHLLYSANPNLRHLATLNYRSFLAGQKGGIVASPRHPFSSPFQNPESDLSWRYPHIYQRGFGKRGNMASVQVYPVGKRWNRAPRQFGRGAQRGGNLALGKMILKPALGVAVPMLAKLGINQIGKLIKKKKKKQRGRSLRALAGQLVESPQFTNLLTDPLMHVTGMARRYGSEGIKRLQSKLASKIRGSQKGGSIKRRLAGDGKMLAGNFIRNAATLLNQNPTRQFVKSAVRKKVPFFKKAISNKAWGAVNSALRQASREGTKLWTSGRKQSQRGGAFGLAAMLGKAILPTVAGAILEPALGGILKQVGLGKKRKRIDRRRAAMNKMFRAAMQRGGRGNSSSADAVIQQALQPSTKPASTSLTPAKKTKKKSKSDILWSIVNSNVAGKFADTFGQKVSDAVLTKIFG